MELTPSTTGKSQQLEPLGYNSISLANLLNEVDFSKKKQEISWENKNPLVENAVHAYEVTKVKVLNENSPSTSSGTGGLNSELEATSANGKQISTYKVNRKS